MSTEKTTITTTGSGTTPGMLRLSYNDASLVQNHNTGAQPTHLAASDPRWVFSMLVRRELEHDSLDEATHERLVALAGRFGLSSMQARALIAIVEHAHARGGIDAIARDEINDVPRGTLNAVGELSDRARWFVFGMLFCWALLIAGLMQVVV